MELSHLDESGNARMVDVSAKPKVKREAWANGRIFLKAGTIDLVKKGLMKKGDVLAVARIAGITAAKRTFELIPLCHQIAIDQIAIEFDFFDGGIAIKSYAVCRDRTGVEMEALTATAVAGLTIYDMCKAVDKTMTISEIKLESKVKSDLYADG